MKAIDDCENDDCVLSGFCHYPHSNNCYMEKEFYETWRKEHGITIEGYQLNKRQLIEMLIDFKNHLLKEQKQSHQLPELPPDFCQDVRIRGGILSPDCCKNPSDCKNSFRYETLINCTQIINNQAIRIQSLLDKQIKDACE